MFEVFVMGKGGCKKEIYSYFLLATILFSCGNQCFNIFFGHLFVNSASSCEKGRFREVFIKKFLRCCTEVFANIQKFRP